MPTAPTKGVNIARRSGVNVRRRLTIQALLGHDKLETTARYARVATGMIAKVESPLARLGELPRRKKPKDGGSTS